MRFDFFFLMLGSWFVFHEIVACSCISLLVALNNIRFICELCFSCLLFAFSVIPLKLSLEFEFLHK